MKLLGPQHWFRYSTTQLWLGSKYLHILFELAIQSLRHDDIEDLILILIWCFLFVIFSAMMLNRSSVSWLLTSNGRLMPVQEFTCKSNFALLVQITSKSSQTHHQERKGRNYIRRKENQKSDFEMRWEIKKDTD